MSALKRELIENGEEIEELHNRIRQIEATNGEQVKELKAALEARAAEEKALRYAHEDSKRHAASIDEQTQPLKDAEQAHSNTSSCVMCVARA